MFSSWNASAATAVGGRHQLDPRGFQPSQDYCLTFKDDHGFILVAADGHGGKAHPYSAEGAKVACDVALWHLLHHPELDPEALVHQWREEIIERHARIVGPSDDSEVVRLYGTTLLAVRYRDGELTVFQVGDGAIILNSASKGPFLPVTYKTKHGPATSSLCNANAARLGHTVVQRVPDLLSAVLLTDGVSDAFDEASLKANWGLSLKDQPWHEFVRELSQVALKAAWTDGDDATVVFAVRSEV
jgi:hypothetical protein